MGIDEYYMNLFPALKSNRTITVVIVGISIFNTCLSWPIRNFNVYLQSCPVSQQLEEQCGPYAYTIVKPMMAYFDQVTQRIDKYNAEMESRNEKINELEKEKATHSRIIVSSFLTIRAKNLSSHCNNK